MNAPTKKCSLSILFIIFIVFSCQQEKRQNQGLGTVSIQVSGAKQAIPHFEKGLLLLHSFEFEDARESFLKAQEIDPLMAMSYWGESMTHNHPLWREQDYERGLAAITRLKVVEEKISCSELEQDFIRSIEILYSDDPIKSNRNQKYADFLGVLHNKYPQNHEVAAFYALALLGSVPIGRDEQVYGQAAMVAQSVLDENPEHPGALHYLIHSYDDPEHAHLAEYAADSYSLVAPDASHALHMPSHIYVALGDWDKVIRSNERSYQASLNRMASRQFDNDARGYHAYHWLEYGYLQDGRIEEARQMVYDMQGFVKDKPSIYGRLHLVFLKGTYLVETEEWHSPVAEIDVDVKDLNIAVRSQYSFLEGMKAIASNDRKALEQIIGQMKNDYELEALSLVDTSITLCTSQTGEQAIQSDIDESETMVMQLQAMSYWMINDLKRTERWLKLSVEKEEKLSYTYGPPFIQKPTHELYADWLLQSNRPEEAKRQYELTLKRAPNRVKALLGIEEANRQLKKS
jgi:tetratricopeptide (TPR) repeat protein